MASFKIMRGIFTMPVSILLVCLLPVFSYAGDAKDMAADPVLEKRMIGLAENLRCLVCQNESLASSHADLAEDLRREVREQMQKGLSDQEIIDYLVSRYGDFVLYDPPVKRSTLVLWYGPFVLLLVGIGVLVYQLRKRKNQIPEAELSAEDAKLAAELLNETPAAAERAAGSADKQKDSRA
ncbi:MAG: cytochrome c-type biogenesis protein [Gallionella sp.]